ncbi:DUF3231 family protein [Aquisalibacillus elongatus]|uniref:Uncharacterized protein DUF3231 n=1 Tax=Aquisalibacillus elongatus TaxID=485577 RepID=A0A3N5C435_9BACI|nr:DUF3231 family protein [Aquisalibacillus elongatus]RPF51071.1 uncharacterized protein DUF3231 [Aquisalibacillus elongatus]
MEKSIHDARLTSSEIANLWTQYMNDSMSICVMKHFLIHAQDEEVKSILEFALELSHRHLDKIKIFLEGDQYPVPIGFTDDDVDLEAPPIFSDKLVIHYMYIMTVHGLSGYAGSLNTSIREDQVEYFIECNKEAMELYRRITKILTEKGLIDRPPNINPPEKPTVVKKQSYLTGWFGKRRPLNAIEVSGIYFNMKKDVIKICMEMASRQMTKNKELQDFFKRGEKICDKQFDTFNKMLSESNLPSTSKLDDQVLNTTTPVFSDKLMLFHVLNLLSTAAGYYGVALALSQRRDLGASYLAMITEVLKYAEDGMNIMIRKKWMEEPPMFDDRDQLAKKKK